MTEQTQTAGKREVYLSPEQVCELIPGMTRALLAQMRFRGDGPPFIKVTPKKVVYRESAIDSFLDSRERTSTAAAS
ncbi:hypothetical protein [Cryocola sp. 340MFSha3.1]|uniref:helix-turn-helix transcriptional regulator n=1 Tax=Cryocola sp. 340MFSha3.1 TaxID=1169145 RepID=UPI00036FA97A|nr:hypothetical protein [Cryocola sp. 340MFSha3.1]